MPGIVTQRRGQARIIRQGKRGGDFAPARGEARSGASANWGPCRQLGDDDAAKVERIAESSATD
jgi:hypothetical protein